jgi:holo-[acyl-carrier protein] synthase
VTELPGIGFDLIEIERLERAMKRRPRLAERLFSPAEMEFAAATRRPGRHLAARFAAKEAAQKALGLGGLRMHEIEVEGGGDEAPRLVLSGTAADVAREAGVALSVSITHSRDLAAAAVIARPAT